MAVGARRVDWTPALLTGLLSLWGAAMVIVAFSAGRLYSMPMIAATLAPFVFIASRNPRLAFLVGMVFTSVLGLSINFPRQVHMGGAPGYSIEAMDLFMLPLLAFLIRDRVVGYRWSLRIGWISVWWFGAIALGLWTVAVGPFREFAAYEIVRMIKLWLLFFVIVNECVRVRHFEMVSWALLAGVLMNVCIALLQYFLKRSLGLQALGEPADDALAGANFGVYLGAGSVFRVSGFLGHPNLLGCYLAMLLPLSLALLFTELGARARFVIGTVSVLALAALVLTLSRTGWMDFAVALVVLGLVVFFHPQLRTRYMSLKGAMLAIFVVAALVAAGPVILRLTASDPGALDFRWQWIEVAWRMVQDKPLLGFGLNSFGYQIVGYSPYSVGKMIEMFGHVWPVVHNVYFLIWAEQGTVGLVLFLGLHVHAFWIAIRSARERLNDRVFAVSIGCACGLLAVMVDGLASFYPRVPGPARVYWIVLALIVAAHYWNRANRPLVRGASSPTGP